jgi:hypothetical protein
MTTAPVPHVDTTERGLLLHYPASLLPARCPTRRRALFTLFPLTFLCTNSLLTESPAWGFFSGTPKTESLGHGRRARLLEDFSYTDPSGRTWLAPAASIVEGASIPWVFRSLIGGAREGKYRNALLVHEVACDQKFAAWQDVHLTFYYALRCGGVDERKAKIAYYAVYHVGPRWGVGTACAEILSLFGVGNENMRQFVDDKTAVAIADWIEETNPGLAELQATKPTSPKITSRQPARVHPLELRGAHRIETAGWDRA